MSSSVGLYVAIYSEGGVYKHWSLFIDTPEDSEKTILHIMGSSTNYYFDMRTSDARRSKSLSELVFLCRVDAAAVGAIKDAGKKAVIHNEFPGYNCQDYVIELLDALEEEEIIDGKDKDYKKNKDKAKAKVEE